jgi:hypothetical protein
MRCQALRFAIRASVLLATNAGGVAPLQSSLSVTRSTDWIAPSGGLPSVSAPHVIRRPISLCRSSVRMRLLGAAQTHGGLSSATLFGSRVPDRAVRDRCYSDTTGTADRCQGAPGWGSDPSQGGMASALSCSMSGDQH